MFNRSAKSSHELSPEKSKTDYPHLRDGETGEEIDDEPMILVGPQDFATTHERRERISEMIPEMLHSIRRQEECPYEIARPSDIDFEVIAAELADPNRQPVPQLTPEEFAELEAEFLQSDK